MTFLPQLRIPATYMRGGTSKGVFFRLQDLPEAAQVPGAARDALLMRVIGSPDPYGKQTDGMGGATSSTSKGGIISAASVPDHDVDYLYGQHRGRPVRDCQRPDRSRPRAARWPVHRAHLAGQHRQDHHRPRADARWASAGDRRFRAGWRDLPGRRNPAGIHRSLRRR
ncbi:hypothetical protein G6F46_013578 [Rhizopus delemar]|nr:hypothetical protein G6F46_013578 [Rhizopus delemar]